MFIGLVRRAAAILSLAAAPFAVHAGPYSAIYVFGDSLSDGGSDYALSTAIHAQIPQFPVIPGAPADYQGHFGNGPVAVEYLASALGLPLTAHYLTPTFLGGATGGTNYAQGGATSGLENASVPATVGPFASGFKGTLAEVGDYKASTAAADPNALYVVWAGANDFIHPGATAISPQCAGSIAPSVCQAVTNVAASVSALAGLGATHILVPNLPDLGKTASAIAAGPGTVAQASAATAAFNGGLAQALAGLSTFFPGDIIPFDTFALFDQILADASAEGFTDTTHSCLTGSSADPASVISPACQAAGPNSYVFWDDIHPTTHAQEILGEAFAAAVGAVPEPSMLALLALGLLALLAAHAEATRRRARR